MCDINIYNYDEKGGGWRGCNDSNINDNNNDTLKWYKKNKANVKEINNK